MGRTRNRYVVIVFCVTIIVWVVFACATATVPKDPNKPAYFFEDESEPIDAGPEDPTRFDPVPSAVSF